MPHAFSMRLAMTYWVTELPRCSRNLRLIVRKLIPQAREIAGCKKGFKEREGMVFIGSAHPPNLDALLYFVQEILPLVLKTDPKCHLTVIGEALRDQIIGINAHVIIQSYTGQIEDPKGLMEKAATVPGVLALTPVIYTQALVSTPAASSGVSLRGIDPASAVRDIDRQIHLNYRLWDTNYFAYDYLNGSSRFAIKYEDMSTKSFVKHYKHLKPEIRDFVFKSYANPVYSMLRETGQSEV